LPKTSVLGHELIVALFSYFYSVAVEACDKRLINNFYCALFHDLPEVLTRDIISPVKHSISGLEHIVNKYEIELINTSILPLVPDQIKDHFLYLLGMIKESENYKKNEFNNRIKNEHMPQIVENMAKYNSDRYEPIDGMALKACDSLAAFTEAALSKSYGIKSRELENGIKIKDNYKNKPDINGINFLNIMQEFENYLNNFEDTQK
ncbi:MAG: HD domain-containing protein, partial [Helicobacteraceae bacterium]|nr:HD domain-containing protein [Helicobacteraceae bacterium]